MGQAFVVLHLFNHPRTFVVFLTDRLVGIASVHECGGLQQRRDTVPLSFKCSYVVLT